MKITALHIDGFGKFSHFHLEPDAGINVISGLNEAGKSTLHRFIRAMFYGFDGSAAGRKDYAALRPWSDPEIYGGWLEAEAEGKRYRIIRDFNSAPDSLFVKDMEAGLMVSDPQGLLMKLLLGMSEGAYVNTISIGQLKSATDKKMGAELKAYIDNMNSTGNPKLNADRAIAYLQKEKESILSSYDPEASGEYTSLLGRIRNIERALEDPKNENRVRHFEEASEQTRQSIGGLIGEQQALDERIRKGEDILAADRIKDDDGLKAIRGEAAGLYARYRRDLAGFRSAKGTVLATLCMLLGVAAIGAGVYMYYQGRPELPFYLAGGAAILLCVLILGRQKRFRSSFRADEEALRAILKTHGNDPGNDEITEVQMKELNGRLDVLSQVYGDTEEARGRRNQISLELSGLNDEQSRLLESLQEQCDVRRDVERQMAELNALKNHAEEKKRSLELNRQLEEKADAIDLAMENLKELSSRVRSTMGAYVNQEASKLLEGVTGGVYRTLDAGSGSDIFLNGKDRMIAVDQLSAGTMDQVYLALRIASVRLVTGGEDLLPLIFDDSFVLYDDERLKKAVLFLTDYYKGQMLIFTCHSREEQVLEDSGKNFRLIRLSGGEEAPQAQEEA